MQPLSRYIEFMLNLLIIACDSLRAKKLREVMAGRRELNWENLRPRGGHILFFSRLAKLFWRNALRDCVSMKELRQHCGRFSEALHDFDPAALWELGVSI